MPRLLLAAVALLLATNAVVLSGVAYNRAGSPRSMELTERELTVAKPAGGTDENSGTRLTLHWQVPGVEEPPVYLYSRPGAPDWLDRRKLSELGFDTAAWQGEKPRDSGRLGLLSRKAVLVLEYDGAAYRETLSLARAKVGQLREKRAESPDDEDRAEKLKRYEKWLRQLEVSQTRLYVIDAGLDQAALSAKYPDSHRYLLVRGEIGLTWRDAKVGGRIRQLYVQSLHVPLPYSRQLESLTRGKAFYRYDGEQIPPRYTVRINTGRRLEPWIASVLAGAEEGRGAISPDSP